MGDDTFFLLVDTGLMKIWREQVTTTCSRETRRQLQEDKGTKLSFVEVMAQN
jgi:hypothetical protein